MSPSLLSIVEVLCGHVYSIMLRIHCVDTIKREILQLIFYFMHTILLHSVIELNMVKRHSSKSRLTVT